MPRSLGHSIALVAWLGVARVVAGFEPITEQQRALTTIAWEPEAPAVILFEKAELQIMDYPRDASSMLEVRTRLKVLTPAGKDYAEVAIPHSAELRLKGFEGRTVQPDGRIVELPKDAIFRERRSRTKKSFVTKAVFPAVEVGSIIDYRYRIYWNNFGFLEPWFFHRRIPSLLSEITYRKPNNMAIDIRGWQTAGGTIHSESKNSPHGVDLRVWMENLIAIPDEPRGFPFSDLSSRFMVIPKEIVFNGDRYPLFDSWKSTYELAESGEGGYSQFLKRDRAVRKKVKTLIANQRSPVKILYHFVRDEIATTPTVGIWTTGGGADDVLAAGSGGTAEKALLLASMLRAAKVDHQLVWAADKREGHVELSLANPWWFERILVRVEHGGQVDFLDPSDRSLAFGRLPPHFEGTQALVLKKRKPEIISLPTTPFEVNLRRATVDLAIDQDGRLSGSGGLELAGHNSWRLLGRPADGELTEGWKEYLAKVFEGFDIDQVSVIEYREEQRLELTWTMEQQAQDVLGDEVSVVPSLPFGPTKQPFALAPEHRQTPVRFGFPRRTEVELRLQWPPGWQVDIHPQAVDTSGPGGGLLATTEIDEGNNSLVVSRRFDVVREDFIEQVDYRALRDLFQLVANYDAQNLVLVRE